MLDIKRALKASPKKRRSSEPLKQLWTPWGERIRDEWLCENAGNKAFRPIEEGERKLEVGRTPILGEHPRPTMMRNNHTMLNGMWDYAIVPIPNDETGSRWSFSRNKATPALTRDEAVEAVKEAAIPETFDGKILVPFSPESALSGVHQTIYPDDMIWYRTVVHPVALGSEETVRQIGDANRLILHFEAGDWAPAISTASSPACMSAATFRSTSISRRSSTLTMCLRSHCASMIRTIQARNRAASRKSNAMASGIPRRAASGRASGWKSCRTPTCARSY